MLRFERLRTAPEVVRIHDLAVLHVGTFAVGNVMSDELVQTGDADPGFPIMGIVLVVADVEEKVPVIEHTDAGELVVCGHG